MIIDKEKLTELLVEKTGLEKQKVEEQLLQLIRRVQQAAEQGKNFQIEGFGTFSVKDRTLHFDPVDTLETEINHKYAGMKPIELIGAFKETPEVEEEEGDPEAFPEDQLQEEQSEETLMDEVPGIRQPSESSVTREEPVVDRTDETGEEKKSKASFVFDTEDTKEEKQASEKAAPESTRTSSKKKKKKDPIGTILTVCVVLLVFGLAGWAVYDFDLLKAFDRNTQVTDSNNQTIQPTSDQSVESVEESVSGPSSVSPDASETEQQQTNSVPDKEGDVNEQAQTTVYGLMGTASSGGNNGYTIVVHSLGSRSKARNMQNGLESEGYRTVLTSAVVNGETYWRVGLGQFESIAGAQEATEELPERYKNNHFIKRIQ